MVREDISEEVTVSRGLNEKESSVPSSEEHSGQRTNKYTGPKVGTRYSCGQRTAGTAGTAVRCSQVGEAGARCSRDGHLGLVGRDGCVGFEVSARRPLEAFKQGTSTAG